MKISDSVAIAAVVSLTIITIAMLSVDCVLYSPYYVLFLKVYIGLANANFLWLFVRVYKQRVIDPGRDDARRYVASDCEDGDETIVPTNRVLGHLGDLDGDTSGRRNGIHAVKTGSGKNPNVEFSHGLVSPNVTRHRAAPETLSIFARPERGSGARDCSDGEL